MATSIVVTLGGLDANLVVCGPHWFSGFRADGLLFAKPANCPTNSGSFHWGSCCRRKDADLRSEGDERD